MAKKEEKKIDPTEPMEFETTFAEVPLTIKNPTDGTKQKYVIREFDGNIREDYLATVQGRALTNDDGEVVGVESFKGMHADLICRCVFRVTESGREAVSLDVANSWPGSVQSAIFKRCQIINGLDDEAEDRAKKKEGEEK